MKEEFKKNHIKKIKLEEKSNCPVAMKWSVL
jgi:hypothetical protein